MENKKPVKELKYSEALQELEAIVRTMQSDNCDIDQLTSLTKRAMELLTECRGRLTTTDEELKGVLAKMELDK